VPGGAAGLQNRRAVFSIVQQRRRFSDKSAFLFSYRVFHAASYFSPIAGVGRFLRPNCYRNGNKEMAIRAAGALRCSYDIASCDQSTPLAFKFWKRLPIVSAGIPQAKILEFYFFQFVRDNQVTVGQTGGRVHARPLCLSIQSLHNSNPCSSASSLLSKLRPSIL
jgi:hypothetical protein